MSDAQQMDEAQPPMIVNGQYVKDLSFEVPGAPGIYGKMQGQNPNIPIHVDIDVQPLQDKVFEVSLRLKIEARLEDETPVFIVDMVYAGIFTLNVPDEHMQPMLLIECPRMLFPFARTIVADVTRDGGFPPMMIQPIDFVHLYRRRMEQAQAPAGHA